MWLALKNIISSSYKQASEKVIILIFQLKKMELEIINNFPNVTIQKRDDFTFKTWSVWLQSPKVVQSTNMEMLPERPSHHVTLDKFLSLYMS